MNAMFRLTRVRVLLLVALAALWPAQSFGAKKVLRLRLDGPIAEKPGDAGGILALIEEKELHTLFEWSRTIREAAADPEIAGLALIIEEPQMALAQVEELTQAIQQFQKKHKPVYCYLDAAGNAAYALAAAADHITLTEYSELTIPGLHMEVSFYKGLLDKIGVEAQMLHCGAYKAALEPFTRTEPSPEFAENINWLLDGLYGRWIQLIADGRKLSVDDVRAAVDQAPLSANQAKALKLVDEVSSFDDFRKRIHKEFGQDVEVVKRYEKDEGPEIDLENPFAIFSIFTQIMKGGEETAKPGVGLVYVAGGITMGKSDESPFGGTVAGSTSIRAALEKARQDENVRAIVLRVDSPGGSALASDIIWRAAKLCADTKPLIVSMGAVAGSGGYYVSLPGDTVFADASTITASIGVVGGKIVWKDLMEDKLGITTTEFTRGRNAGLMSLNRKWTDSEHDWINKYMNDVYEQFKGRVMTSRGDRLKKDLEQIAGGRVYTGAQALDLGLVDKIGTLQDAIDLAANKAGLGKDCPVHIIPRPSDIGAIVEMMKKMFGQDGEDDFEIALRARLAGDMPLRTHLEALTRLAPRQARQWLDALRNLELLSREHVGCFMPAVPLAR